jgi:hypothetical protein
VDQMVMYFLAWKLSVIPYCNHHISLYLELCLD